MSHPPTTAQRSPSLVDDIGDDSGDDDDDDDNGDNDEDGDGDDDAGISITMTLPMTVTINDCDHEHKNDHFSDTQVRDIFEFSLKIFFIRRLISSHRLYLRLPPTEPDTALLISHHHQHHHCLLQSIVKSITRRY